MLDAGTIRMKIQSTLSILIIRGMKHLKFLFESMGSFMLETNHLCKIDESEKEGSGDLSGFNQQKLHFTYTRTRYYTNGSPTY